MFEQKKIIYVYNKVKWNITNCDSLVHYKLRWTVITNCDSFFITKCDPGYNQSRQVLQCDGFITNCDRYYKVR